MTSHANVALLELIQRDLQKDIDKRNGLDPVPSILPQVCVFIIPHVYGNFFKYENSPMICMMLFSP